MKNSINLYFFYILLTSLVFISNGCERDIEDLESATYSKNPDVFIDDFSSGLNYAAFGNSDVLAFQVDTKEKYAGTKSMRFEVPDFGSASGAYAGGTFFTSVGRDLSDYNALTFWVKASQPANIDVLGFGNDLGANKFQTSITNLPVNSNWKKVIIPIPEPSKLKAEKGMFFYSEGPENNRGYTFWIDEVKFENIGTINFQSASILGGENRTVTSFIGVKNKIDNLVATFNLPNGTNQSVSITPYYLTFSSSNPEVATVDEIGNVNTVGIGSSQITAALGSTSTTGRLTVNSQGNFVSAPTPTYNASNVISLFSDHYSNSTVDYYNGYWAPYQTTQSADFDVNGDHVLNYTNFNFVGIQFSSPTINATTMSHLHIDLYLPNSLQSGANMKFQVVDFGADGIYGGNDDKTHEITVAAPVLQSQNWVSLDLPFSAMTSLTSRSHLGQIIFVGTNISNFYADNIYFYNDGSLIPSTPTIAAPTPTQSASSVLSIFSDSYSNLGGTDFNPNWGQSTQVSQINISGNNILKYANLNYQGTQLLNNIDVSSYQYIHLDYYTANSSSLKFYLISPGPIETAYNLSVPS
ncbi:MAG: hypothetical protein KBA06_02350, partial [Saprospiraceae bacterium]|nr:hypothetical protein [Saprospiraceae bacterium]